jgi:hypothetical protein
MKLVQYEKNSYGQVFKKLSDGSFSMEKQENNAELNAWKLVNGEPGFNINLDLIGPIPLNATPPLAPTE